MVFQRIKESESPTAFQAPSFWNWIKAQFGIFLLWFAWVFALINQASRVAAESWLPEPGLDSVFQTLRSLLNYSMLDQPSQVQMIWILYALVFCLAVLHFRKNISRFVFLAVLFIIPCLGVLVMNFHQPFFIDRSLIWTAIPLFLMLAAGIAQFRFHLLVILVLGIIGTYNLFTAGDNYRHIQKEDWSSAAGFVAKFAEEEDLVLFNAPWVQIPFDYYFKPFEEQYLIQVEKHGVPAEMFESSLLEPKMTAGEIPKIISLLSGHNRVWLVYSQEWNTDPMGLIPQTLASQMELIGKRDFYGGEVQLYGFP
jgi:hypothetical protein